MATTYRTKYSLSFSDVKGNERTLEILSKNYFGTVTQMVAGDEPVTIAWENDDDFYTPIIGSTCTINLYVTENTSYDEFQVFDERQYKVRLSSGSGTSGTVVDTLWEAETELWNEANNLWDSSGDVDIYWEGWLVSDAYREQFISTPYILTLKAIDGLGTLDSFEQPDGEILLDGTGAINTGLQTNFDSAFSYVYKILQNLDLNFDIYIQNKIRSTTASPDLTLLHDILLNEFSLMDDFSKRNAKEVLENILRIINARIFQSNGSWYIISNSNYYDEAIVPVQTTTQSPLIPTVETLAPTNPTSSSMTLNGNVTSDNGLGIIERGFYFGTSSNYLNNTPKITVAGTTGTFNSAKTGLSSGTRYYITAYAVNSAGEGVGATVDKVAQPTTTLATTSGAPVFDNTKTKISEVTGTAMKLDASISSNGGTALTQRGFYFGTTQTITPANKNIVSGTSLGDYTLTKTFTFSATGTLYYMIPYATNGVATAYGTVQGMYSHNVHLCRRVSDNTVFDAQYNTSFAVGGNVTLSNSGSTCYIVVGSKYVSNPSTVSALPTISGSCATTQVPATTVAPATTTTKAPVTTSTTVFPNANIYVVRRLSDGFERFVVKNASFAINSNVILSVDASNCYKIISDEVAGSTSGLPTIASVCNITTTTSAVTTTPPLTHFMHYRDCATGGMDQLISVGNTNSNFPEIIKNSSNECFFKYQQTQETSSEWVTRDYTTGFSDCAACQGITTTAAPTTSTTAPPTVYYKKYITCGEPTGAVRKVSNTTNSFPNVIKDNNECFEAQSGNISVGPDGAVGNFTSYANCTACNAVATTTQAFTTTVQQCSAVQVFASTTSQTDACCNVTTLTTFYITASSLANATIVYKASDCSRTVDPGTYFTDDGQTYYFWSGSTLTNTNCPACP